jgi:hypothetical protein
MLLLAGYGNAGGYGAERSWPELGCWNFFRRSHTPNQAAYLTGIRTQLM